MFNINQSFISTNDLEIRDSCIFNFIDDPMHFVTPNGYYYCDDGDVDVDDEDDDDATVHENDDDELMTMITLVIMMIMMYYSSLILPFFAFPLNLISICTFSIPGAWVPL